MRLDLLVHIHQARLHLFPRRHCPGHPHRMYRTRRLILIQLRAENSVIFKSWSNTVSFII